MAINLPIISEWNPAGIDKAINDFKKLETNGQKASFAIKKAAVPAGLAIAALGAVAFDAVKAFAEDDAAAQKLATTLGNVTGASDAQVKSVEDFISKTSIAAAVADDELRPALDSLVRGTGDVTKAQDLLGLALNVSAGTGKDLGAVSDALSKAFNGNLGPLKKLDQALADLIKSGATTDEVFAALGETFKGQASTAANTTQGKMKNLGIQMGEFKESVGQAVMPLAEKLLPSLLKLADFVKNNTTLVVILGGVVGGLAIAIVAVNAATTAWAATTKAFAAIQAAFNAILLANPIFLIAAAIVAAIAVLVALQMKFDIFGKAIDGLKAGFMAWWGVVKFVFGSIKAGFGELKDLAVAIFDGVGGAFKGVINAVISAMEKGLNFAIKGLNIILDGIDKAAGPWVNFGTIPDVKLPRLAEGGIVTRPTIAMIGEGREPEAVIPLSKLGSMGVGGGSGITINVSSADPNAVVAALQQYIRDRGALPITVNPTAFRG
jgi:hypothetical protein